MLDKIGVYAFAWGRRPPTADSLRDLACHAERVGVDSIHMPWHYTLSQHSFNWGNSYILDPLVVIPHLAAATSRIRLGIDPWVPTVIHPFAWAQYLSSLDAVSGGRTISGARTAWWKDDITIGRSTEEWSEPGYDEALEIVTKLWRGEALSGEESTIWDVAGLRLEPAPARPLPLWIDAPDDKAIGRAARWGTALRPLFATEERLRHLRQRLDDAANLYGRTVQLATSTILAITTTDDAATWIAENVSGPMEQRLNGRDIGDTAVVGSPEQCADHIGRIFASGVDYLLLDTQFHGWQTEEYSMNQIDRLAELVVPRLETH